MTRTEAIERLRDIFHKTRFTGDISVPAEVVYAIVYGGLLEWEKNGRDDDSLWTKCEGINRYYTIEPESHVYRLETTLMLSEYGSDFMGLHPTVESAKSAAQSDYDRRTLS